jgi:hypothetical protein
MGFYKRIAVNYSKQHTLPSHNLVQTLRLFEGSACMKYRMRGAEMLHEHGEAAKCRSFV